MKKRLLAAGLMLVMMLSLLSLGAWADDSAAASLTLTPSSDTPAVGGTVTVTVALADVGDGYNSLAAAITYDADVLTYKSESAALGSAATAAGVTVLRTDEATVPGVGDKAVAVLNTGTAGKLTFEYASSGMTAAGTLLTLTFTVADTAAVGAETAVGATVTRLARLTADNTAGTALTYNVTPAAMTVAEKSAHTPGDINGDGDVNKKDVTRLINYLNLLKQGKSESVVVVQAALNVNGDGEVNKKDVTRLINYLNLLKQGTILEIH